MLYCLYILNSLTFLNDFMDKVTVIRVSSILNIQDDIASQFLVQYNDIITFPDKSIVKMLLQYQYRSTNLPDQLYISALIESSFVGFFVDCFNFQAHFLKRTLNKLYEEIFYNAVCLCLLKRIQYCHHLSDKLVELSDKQRSRLVRG